MATTVEKIRVSELEKTLGKTGMGKCKKFFDEYIVSNLQNNKGDTNYFIPLIKEVVDTYTSTKGNGLKKFLNDLYSTTLALDDYTGVSEEVRMIQAVMFDGLVVGINIQKDLKVDIFTANTDLIFGISAGKSFSLAKVAELNRNNEVGGVRIDISYTSDNEFEYSIKGVRKPNNLTLYNPETGEGNFVFLPYGFFVETMKVFEKLLNEKRVLKVTQNSGVLSKVRYITTDSKMLAKYSDNEEFAKSLKPAFYPLKGFFYAPVLGAPSTTIGCTKIDLTVLDKLEAVEPSKIRVEKAEDGMKSLVTESTAISILAELYDSDPIAYGEVIKSMPNRKKIIDKEAEELPSPYSFAGYLHGLGKGEYTKALSKVPGLGDSLEGKEDVFKGFEQVDFSNLSPNDIADMLKQGIYRFTIRKENCEFSSMVLTNNEDILKQLYGNDYFGCYESIGARLHKLTAMFNETGKLVDGQFFLGSREKVEGALKYCGFDHSPEEVSRVIGYCNGTQIEVDNAEDWGKDILFEKLDGLLIPRNVDGTKEKRTVKRTPNPNVIMARGCFATKTSKEVREYYKNLDTAKILSMARIG